MCSTNTNTTTASSSKAKENQKWKMENGEKVSKDEIFSSYSVMILNDKNTINNGGFDVAFFCFSTMFVLFQ